MWLPRHSLSGIKFQNSFSFEISSLLHNVFASCLTDLPVQSIDVKKRWNYYVSWSFHKKKMMTKTKKREKDEMNGEWWMGDESCVRCGNKRVPFLTYQCSIIYIVSYHSLSMSYFLYIYVYRIFFSFLSKWFDILHSIFLLFICCQMKKKMLRCLHFWMLNIDTDNFFGSGGARWAEQSYIHFACLKMFSNHVVGFAHSLIFFFYAFIPKKKNFTRLAHS